MGSMTRAFRRNAAKNLMKDMGIGNVNRKMGRPRGALPKQVISKLQKTEQGRMRLAKIFSREENQPLWKTVTDGKWAEKAKKAFDKMSVRRALMIEHERMLGGKKGRKRALNATLAAH